MLCMRIGRRIDSTSSVSIIKPSVHKDVRVTKNSYADPEILRYVQGAVLLNTLP